MCCDSRILSASVLFGKILFSQFLLQLDILYTISKFEYHNSTSFISSQCYALWVVFSLVQLCQHQVFMYINIKTKGKIFHLMDGSNFMLYPHRVVKGMTDDADYIINHHLNHAFHLYMVKSIFKWNYVFSSIKNTLMYQH